MVAVGAVFTIGNRTAGEEVFDMAPPHAAVAGEIIAGSAPDSDEFEAEAAPSAQGLTMVRPVMSAATIAYPVPGLGRAVRLTRGEVAGAGLVADDRCVPLGIFAM